MIQKLNASPRQFTYSQIIISYNARCEFAVKEVMGRVYRSHTGVSVIVRIHAETKWFIIPEWWSTPMSIIMTIEEYLL